MNFWDKNLESSGGHMASGDADFPSGFWTSNEDTNVPPSGGWHSGVMGLLMLDRL